MLFNNSAVRFLLSQNNTTKLISIAISQLFAIIDIGTAFSSSRTMRGGGVPGIIITELIVLVVFLPLLLLLFRIISRYRKTLKMMYVIIALILSAFAAAFLSSGTHIPGFITFSAIIFTAFMAGINLVILFFARGNGPLFDTATDDINSEQESNVATIVRKKYIESSQQINSAQIIGSPLKNIENPYQKLAIAGGISIIFIGCIIFLMGKPNSKNSADSSYSDEKVPATEERSNGERVITPELAKSMGSGSRFDFSGCIGKTTHECVESAIYAKTYYDGIEFNLGISQVDSCGPQARFLTVFGPKGFTTTGCWVKNGTEFKLWIFMPKDSNGNYTKVSGPIVRSIEVMPYYKTHNLPDL